MRMQLVLSSHRNIIDQPSKSFNLVTKLGEPHTVEKSFACMGGSLMIIADVLEALATLYDLDWMQPIHNAIFTFRRFGFSGDVKRIFEQHIFRIKQSVATSYQNQLTIIWGNSWHFFDISRCNFWITLPAALHWCRIQVFWTPATCSTAWQPREPQEQAMQKQSAP